MDPVIGIRSIQIEKVVVTPKPHQLIAVQYGHTRVVPGTQYRHPVRVEIYQPRDTRRVLQSHEDQIGPRRSDLADDVIQRSGEGIKVIAPGSRAPPRSPNDH